MFQGITGIEIQLSFLSPCIYIYICMKSGTFGISCSLYMGMVLMSQLTYVGLKSMIYWFESDTLTIQALCPNGYMLWWYCQKVAKREIFLAKLNYRCDCHSINLLVCHPGSVLNHMQHCCGCWHVQAIVFLKISGPKIWTFFLSLICNSYQIMKCYSCIFSN